MLPEITVQLFSVREQAAADYESTIRAIANMGFKNVEPAGFPGSTVEKSAKLFKELNIKTPSCHSVLPLGDDKNRVIDEALTLGIKYIITGCPANFRENYKNADAIKAMAAQYCEAAEIAAEHGMQVGYHNHDWDLIDVDGKPGYKYFLENTPETILWEADLFWVARAGLDPADFIKEIGPRGKLLHFKDGIVNSDAKFTEAETEDGKIMISDSAPFLPAGAGQVDLISAGKVADYTEYIAVELDRYEGDMMNAVQESYTYLTTNKIAKGNK